MKPSIFKPPKRRDYPKKEPYFRTNKRHRYAHVSAEEKLPSWVTALFNHCAKMNHRLRMEQAERDREKILAGLI